MLKGKRVTQKLKRRSKQLFQVSMWMLLVAFVRFYIRRGRDVDRPAEDVFGAPFNACGIEVTVDNEKQ